MINKKKPTAGMLLINLQKKSLNNIPANPAGIDPIITIQANFLYWSPLIASELPWLSLISWRKMPGSSVTDPSRNNHNSYQCSDMKYGIEGRLDSVPKRYGTNTR